MSIVTKISNILEGLFNTRLIGISFIFILLPSLIFSQTYLEQGNLFMQNEEFKKADSVYTVAIESLPYFRDAYFNRAIARLNMNNMKGFCKDMKEVALMDDTDAENIRCVYCVDIDTVYVQDTIQTVKSGSNFEFKEFVYKEKFYDLTEGYYYDKKDNLIANYSIIGAYKWFDLVPDMPEFEGGTNKMNKFLERHKVYPESEYDAYRKYAGSFATVYIQCDISEEGKVERVQVWDKKQKHTSKYISWNFVKEAIRLVNSLPDFKPGYFMGSPVAVRLIIPIEFEFAH